MSSTEQLRWIEHFCQVNQTTTQRYYYLHS